MAQSALKDGETDAPLSEPPRVAAPARRFDFVHKIFQIDNGIFQPDPATDEPVYCVDLGDLRANLTFATLRVAFDIPADGEDSHLLDEVARGLVYVKRIRPGDTIPSELLDGSASWSVSATHRAIAKGRIWVGLVAWLAGRAGAGGRGTADISMLELAKVAESPEARAHVQSAFGRLAAELGYGEANRAQVVEKVERLVDELAYIEALRERVARARRIVELLKRLRTVYRRERGTTDEIERTVLLIEKPVYRLECDINEVDAQAGETNNALRNLLRQITFIRQKRDRLHAQLMKWDDILAAWHGVEAERTATTHRLIRNTYRFVARYFPAESEWVR